MYYMYIHVYAAYLICTMCEILVLLVIYAVYLMYIEYNNFFKASISGSVIYTSIAILNISMHSMWNYRAATCNYAGSSGRYTCFIIVNTHLYLWWRCYSMHLLKKFWWKLTHWSTKYIHVLMNMNHCAYFTRVQGIPRYY